MALLRARARFDAGALFASTIFYMVVTNAALAVAVATEQLADAVGAPKEPPPAGDFCSPPEQPPNAAPQPPNAFALQRPQRDAAGNSPIIHRRIPH